MNDGIAELIDEIDREKIERARRMSPDEKFLAGAELFDQVCEITKQGIRNQHPHFDEIPVLDRNCGGASIWEPSFVTIRDDDRQRSSSSSTITRSTDPDFHEDAASGFYPTWKLGYQHPRT